MQEVPVSPTPPGLSPLATRCTSTRGAAEIRSDGKSLKLFCCTRPLAMVISLPSAALRPKVTPPSSCARTPSAFTTCPQSMAHTTRSTRGGPWAPASVATLPDLFPDDVRRPHAVVGHRMVPNNAHDARIESRRRALHMVPPVAAHLDVLLASVRRAQRALQAAPDARREHKAVFI